MKHCVYELAPTGNVKSLDVLLISQASIRIMWEEVDCDQRNGRIIEYIVVISNNSNTYNLTSTEQYITVNDLVGGIYRISVAAVNSIGIGPFSDYVEIEIVTSNIILILVEYIYHCPIDMIDESFPIPIVITFVGITTFVILIFLILIVVILIVIVLVRLVYYYFCYITDGYYRRKHTYKQTNIDDHFAVDDYVLVDMGVPVDEHGKLYYQ